VAPEYVEVEIKYSVDFNTIGVTARYNDDTTMYRRRWNSPRLDSQHETVRRFLVDFVVLTKNELLKEGSVSPGAGERGDEGVRWALAGIETQLVSALSEQLGRGDGS
jgi:hypothetical protein